jgi:hypothetical protein
MAHFIIYKRPIEITNYEVNFEDLLTDSDLKLDTNLTKVVVENSAGEDKTDYLLQKLIFPVTTPKRVQAIFANGLNGEDYLAYFNAFGDVSFQTNGPNRILEIRVRNRLAGNL